jgi:hypothetical protein
MFMAIASTISQGVTGGIAAIRNKKTASMQNELYDRQEGLRGEEKDFNKQRDDEQFQNRVSDSAFNKKLSLKQDAFAKEDIATARDNMKTQAKTSLFNKTQGSRAKGLKDKQRNLMRLR